MIERSRTSDAKAQAPLRVHAVFWNVIGPGSVANAVTELMENLPDSLVERRLYCLNADQHSPRDYLRPVFPSLLFRALSKARVSFSMQGRIGCEIVLRSVRPGDIVYVWPPFHLSLIRRARARGAIVVAERTNCMAPMAFAALTRAFARRGLSLPQGWFDPDEVAKERAEITGCDFVTAPNALVNQSLQEVGINRERILDTSYGFNPERLAVAIGIQRPERPPVFAFVGSGIIGKGLDVLLEAWERAAVDGTLLIAGEIDPELALAYQKVLARPDVEALGFVQDIATVYAAADVFVFPSHAEGGPQVTYEAAACGLPSIVSPMGAGRLVRHEQEGLVIDPLQVGDLAAAITTLAKDKAMRQRLAINAVGRAREFTWEKVGTRLHKHFSRIAGRSDRRPESVSGK